MHQFTFLDPRHALTNLALVIRADGTKVSPRGQDTHELQHVTLTIKEPQHCLMQDMGRKLNPRLAAAEALMLLGGFADEKWMTRVSPRYLEFTGGAMSGAYGPRLAVQMPLIEQALKDDPHTRQAVATIWSPSSDLMVKHGDRPCTVYLSFMIRDGQLITSTYMRSQDLYLGFTYDAVMFSQLHLTLAHVLDIAAGPWVHTVQSLHIYDRDWEKVSQLTVPPPFAKTSLYGLEADNWYEVQSLARAIAYNGHEPEGMTATEEWLRDNSEDARDSR